MGDNETTESNNTPPTVTPPTVTPPQPAAQPALDLTGLMTALNALPETIARSVKEAVGTPAKPVAETKATEEKVTEKSAEKPAAAEKPASLIPGKKRSFAGWWFGE
jgi:hypothetical protein